jgi:hypothetical protein
MLAMVEVANFLGFLRFVCGFFDGEFVVNGWWIVVG